MEQSSPLILAIDCSDQACSVALGNREINRKTNEQGRGHFLIEEFTDEPRQHAKKLLPMYRQLLSRSSYRQEDIRAIAVASGPGSFTGLRIGFSFAQGLSFALNVPLIEVSSLEALAASNTDLVEDKNINQVQVCLDARMGELYVAGFNWGNGILERQHPDALIGVNDFDQSEDYSVSALIGSGFALDGLSSLNSAVIAPGACIHASAVHTIAMARFSKGEVMNAIGAEPAYLRRENAWKTVKQQRQAANDKLANSKTASK